MRRVLLCGSLFCCVFAAPLAVAHAEEEAGNGKGIMSGVLEKVETKVIETTESVGEVVVSAVEGVDEAVKDTVSITEDTVETLVEPSTKRPVSEILDHTVEFVEGTVNNVVPVVEKTMETASTTTSTVTDIVEIEEVADSFEKVVRNEIPPQNEDAPAINVQPDEVVGKPVFDSNEDVTDDDQSPKVNSQEVLEFTESVVDDDTKFIANEALEETAVRPVNQVARAAKVEMPTEQEIPRIPTQSNSQWDKTLIAITTSSTSVAPPLKTIGGNADVVPGIVDGFAVRNNLSGRQWVHSDEQMRIQWVHAPPGQPPQSTPFLQTNK